MKLPIELIQHIYEFNADHRPQWYKVMNSLVYHFKDKMYLNKNFSIYWDDNKIIHYIE